MLVCVVCVLCVEVLWRSDDGVLPPDRLHVSTPLKPPIAFGLLGLASSDAPTPQQGLLLIDPMAGCGTIGEVAVLSSGKLSSRSPFFAISGDSCPHAVNCAATNARNGASLN